MLGYRKVQVESECQRVCLALKNKNHLCAEFGNVLVDIFSLCDSVQIVGFYHCKRTSNIIVHGLAKITLQAEHTMI